MHTVVASEFDKESNRGRDASIINRRGPVDDFDRHVWHYGRHGRPQLYFGDHKIGKSHDHAVEESVSKCMWVYRHLLAPLNELDDGNAICGVKSRDLDHIPKTIPPKAMLGR